MSNNQPRDEGGKFTEKIDEQDILKVFDSAEAPFLTARELAEELPVSREAINYRLEKMREKDMVGKKKTGARSVGWWAKVAPELSDEAADRVAASKERDEFVALEDV